MNPLVFKTKPSKLAYSLIGCLFIGLVVAFLLYWGLDKLTKMTGSQMIPVVLLAAVAVTLGAVGLTLAGWVKRVEADARSLRITKLFGGTTEYPLHNHRFTSHLTHTQTRSGVETTRVLKVHGPQGEEDYTLPLEPEEYNALVNLLVGTPEAQGYGQFGAPGPDPGHPQPHAAAARVPLNFQPQTFAVDRKQVNTVSIVFGSLAGLMVVAGVVIGLAMQEPDMLIVMLILFGFLALIFAIVPIALQLGVRKLPKTLTVAPTWLAIDGRGYNYADMQVLQIKPPGSLHDRSVKILMKSGEKVVHKLGLKGNYEKKMFPNYEHFATLLGDAATAAAGVVRFDYS